MGLSSLIKTTPVWVVLLQTGGSSLQGEKEDWRGVYVWRGRLRRVEEGIPFNCNHSGSTAGNYMPCIQLERRGEDSKRRGLLSFLAVIARP